MRIKIKNIFKKGDEDEVWLQDKIKLWTIAVIVKKLSYPRSHLVKDKINRVLERDQHF